MLNNKAVKKILRSLPPLRIIVKEDSDSGFVLYEVYLLLCQALPLPLPVLPLAD